MTAPKRKAPPTAASVTGLTPCGEVAPSITEATNPSNVAVVAPEPEDFHHLLIYDS